MAQLKKNTENAELLQELQRREAESREMSEEKRAEGK